jgi:predicted nucleotidyltransferase
MAQGNSFARARALVVESLFGPQIAQVLASPNDNLALEYVRAAETLGLHFDFLATKRKGAGHDQAGIFEGFASASQIRQNVALGESIEALLPAASYEVFKEEFENFRASADYKKLEAAVLYALRSKTAADIAKVPDISEGIENRIHFAASQAVSLEDLFEKAKAKRYSHARIRRIVLHAFLGIEASQTEGLPPYIRILAIGDGGKSLLKQAAQSAKLPLVMRAADVKGLDEKSKALFALESRATDIYNISLPKILPSGSDYRAEIFVS